MLTTASGSGRPILTPDQVGALLVQPALSMSVAAQVATIVNTTAHNYRVPIVTADPTAAWVAEGAEIPVSDPTIQEVMITPAKLAGLSVITRELAEDSSPAAAQAVGEGLARDIARKLDAAFFGTKGTDPVQPSGLDDVTTTGAVSAAFTSTDPFAEALSLAEISGATITAFVTDPGTALVLAKVKKATGSNEPLLGNDPTAPTSRTVLGVPLLVSPAVTPGTIWGIPRDRVHLVVRAGATVETDSSVFFTSDRVAVKATMRVGWGFPHAAALVKITAP